MNISLPPGLGLLSSALWKFVNKNDVMYRQNPITGPSQVSFHDFWIENHGSNPYGQVDDACIKLQAPFISLEGRSENTVCIPGMASLAGRTEMTFDLEEDKQRDNLSALFFLRRLSYKSTSDIEEVMLFGLIICPVSRSSQDHGHLEAQIVLESINELGLFRCGLLLRGNVNIGNPPQISSYLFKRDNIKE